MATNEICRVTLAQIATRAKGNDIAIALLSRLMSTANNTGKLCVAKNRAYIAVKR
jgi:hypothetical protein